MKRLLIFAIFLFVGLPHPASADAGLLLNPLKYEDTFTNTSVRQGYVTVSNPSDASVAVSSSVQGFRQIDLDGNLQFFDDQKLTAAIIPGLANFTLGPRESIRVSFFVDPAKLPKGGIYAAIFFQTQPPTGFGNASYLVETSKVGTLLMLQNGKAGEKTGKIKSFDLPFWQFGNSISGALVYQNTNRDPGAPAFSPQLSVKVGYVGKAKAFAGSLVLPLSSRKMTMTSKGSYFGLLPVTLGAAESGNSTTKFVFACTGWCQYVLLVVLATLSLIGFELIRRRFLYRKFRIKKPR